MLVLLISTKAKLQTLISEGFLDAFRNNSKHYFTFRKSSLIFVVNLDYLRTIFEGSCLQRMLAYRARMRRVLGLQRRELWRPDARWRVLRLRVRPSWVFEAFRRADDLSLKAWRPDEHDIWRLKYRVAGNSELFPTRSAGRHQPACLALDLDEAS